MDESTCTGGCACQRASDDRGSVSRRGVLAGSAAAVAVMALGACASAGRDQQPRDRDVERSALQDPDRVGVRDSGGVGEPHG